MSNVFLIQYVWDLLSAAERSEDILSTINGEGHIWPCSERFSHCQQFRNCEHQHMVSRLSFDFMSIYVKDIQSVDESVVLWKQAAAIFSGLSTMFSRWLLMLCDFLFDGRWICYFKLCSGRVWFTFLSGVRCCQLQAKRGGKSVSRFDNSSFYRRCSSFVLPGTRGQSAWKSS